MSFALLLIVFITTYLRRRVNLWYCVAHPIYHELMVPCCHWLTLIWQQTLTGELNTHSSRLWQEEQKKEPKVRWSIRVPTNTEKIRDRLLLDVQLICHLKPLNLMISYFLVLTKQEMDFNIKTSNKNIWENSIVVH